MNQIELLSHLLRIIDINLKLYSHVEIDRITWEYYIYRINNVKQQYLKPFKLYANKHLSLNRIISVTLTYLKPFNYDQTNDI